MTRPAVPARVQFSSVEGRIGDGREKLKFTGNPHGFSRFERSCFAIFGDVVFLEEADGRDAGGSGFEAGAGVGQSDSAQSQDRDVCLAGLREEC